MQDPQAPSRVDSMSETLDFLEKEKGFGAESIARGWAS